MTDAASPHSGAAVVFGGAGSIGAVVAEGLVADGYAVTRTGRREGNGAVTIPVDPFDPLVGMGALDGVPALDVVVWAQGSNTNDSVLSFDLDSHMGVLNANCAFVAATMAYLLQRDRVRDGARLCVVSSIWQHMARQDKLSYTVSKAALGGLVRSAAVDLGSRGILVNAVLPGVVDTPMTRSVLTEEQIKGFAEATPFKRLVSAEDVAGVVRFLCSSANRSVTGQSVAVDLGYSCGRLV